VIAPVFGALADRLDRRRLMIGSDLAGSVFFCVLVFAHSPLTLVGVAFGASLVSIPFGPAASAAVPNLATENDLRWANSLVSTTGWMGRLAGYGVGGALLATTNAPTVFIINAVSFLGSAMLVYSIHRPFAETRDADEAKPRAREGFAFIFADRALAGILIGWAFAFFAVNIATVANPPLAQDFHVGSTGYGVLEAMYAGGSVLGAACGRWLTRRLEIPAILFGTVAIAVASLIVALTSSFVLVLVVVLVSAVFDSLAAVAGDSYIQQATPDRMRGRVFGAVSTSFTLGNTVAFLMVAPLMTAIGPRGVYAVGGAASVVAFGVLAFGFAGAKTQPLEDATPPTG